jgi:hypothetical protein
MNLRRGSIAAVLLLAALVHIEEARTEVAEQELLNGHYGCLPAFWDLLLSAESGEKLHVTAELREDGVYTQLIDMRLAGGKVIEFERTPVQTRAFKRKDGTVRFDVLVPVPEQFRTPYGRWQMVTVRIISTGDRIDAVADTAPSSLKCEGCLRWQGSKSIARSQKNISWADCKRS